MAGRCTVCNHPQRKAIDAALSLRSERSIAAQFGLSGSAVHNHKTVHVKPAIARELARRESMGPRILLDKLERYIEAAERGIELAENRGNVRDLAAILKEARETLKLLGQASGLWQEKNSTTIVDARIQTANLGSLTVDDLRSLASLGSSPKAVAIPEAVDADFTAGEAS